MKLFENEEIIFTTKNKQFILTSHRIRTENKSFWGSSIKSILLDNLTYSELTTVIPFKQLWKVLLTPIIINGSVFLINNFLFKSALLIFFFGEVNINSVFVVYLFYTSIVISIYYLINFFLSFKKIISFHAFGSKIEVELKWIDFEERESFISKVEALKVNLNKKKN